jgi:hypothetical protein
MRDGGWWRGGGAVRRMRRACAQRDEHPCGCGLRARSARVDGLPFWLSRWRRPPGAAPALPRRRAARRRTVRVLRHSWRSVYCGVSVAPDSSIECGTDRSDPSVARLAHLEPRGFATPSRDGCALVGTAPVEHGLLPHSTWSRRALDPRTACLDARWTRAKHLWTSVLALGTLAYRGVQRGGAWRERARAAYLSDVPGATPPPLTSWPACAPSS